MTPFPLTPAQQRIWFLDQLDPGNLAYVVLSGRTIRGPLDVEALARALTIMVERHEALRTTFHSTEGEPWQQINDGLRVPLDFEDLTALPSSDRGQRLNRLAEDLATHRFNLAEGPLLKVLLVRTGRDDHELHLAVHHIVVDGWAMSIFYRELLEFYHQETRPSTQRRVLPPVPSYRAYAERRSAAGPNTADLAYWTQELSGLPAELALPTDRPRPAVASFEGRRLTFLLDERLTADLRALAASERVTLFVVLMAGFQTLLARYAGQDDFAVGTPVAGRPDAADESVIGLFVNTVAIRADLSEDPSFRDLLRATQIRVLNALEHQDLPVEHLIDELVADRDLARNPLFQVMLAFNNTPPPPPASAPLVVEPLDLVPAAAKLDLTLNIRDGAALRCDVYYATDLFDAARMERLAGHLRTLLTAAAVDPGTRVSRLPVLTPEEHAQLIGWNDTAREYRGGSLTELLCETAERDPSSTALWFRTHQVSYGELVAGAGRLASVLIESGVEPGDIVAVRMHRSIEMVTALHAVLMTGAAYLPLEPDIPEGRAAAVVADTGIRVLVTESANQGHGISGIDTVVAADSVDLGRLPAEPVPVPPDALAYVIQTSGSTGTPKAIGVSHRAVVNRLRWMQDAFALTPEDRLLQKTPFGFDVSVWELFWPTLAGVPLVIAEPEGHRDPSYLADLIQKTGVTTIHFVPSMLDAFLDEPGVAALTTLRRVICSGEALSGALAARHRAGLPGVGLHNLYGPTEAAIDVSWHACTPEDDTLSGVPIGLPIANTSLTIRDRRLAEQPVGIPGELCIGGVQLARGYLGKAGLTAERFVADRDGVPGARIYRTGDLAVRAEDGRISFLGRLDHQVKVNGFRIELGDVEAALAASPAVDAAVVTASPTGLVAYVVGSVADLRAFLRTRLPDYMIPSHYVQLDALPLTRNGKIDRNALPRPDTAVPRAEAEPPHSAAEKVTAAAIEELLGVRPVGAGDNFFMLGGDSIRSLKLVARLRRAGFAVTVQQVFRSSTVRELAAALVPAAAGLGADVAGSRPFGLLSDADLALLNPADAPLREETRR